MLLEAKGFENAIVNLTGETADVVVPEAELEDHSVQPVEDVCKKKDRNHTGKYCDHAIK